MSDRSDTTDTSPAGVSPPDPQPPIPDPPPEPQPPVPNPDPPVPNPEPTPAPDPSPPVPGPKPPLSADSSSAAGDVEVSSPAVTGDDPASGEATDPAAPDLAATGPAASDLAATDPAVTDPVTDPAAADPAATDPAATDPAATDFALTDPEVMDPAATDPAATDPQPPGPTPDPLPPVPDPQPPGPDPLPRPPNPEPPPGPDPLPEPPTPEPEPQPGPSPRPDPTPLPPPNPDPSPSPLPGPPGPTPVPQPPNPDPSPNPLPGPTPVPQPPGPGPAPGPPSPTPEPPTPGPDPEPPPAPVAEAEEGSLAPMTAGRAWLPVPSGEGELPLTAEGFSDWLVPPVAAGRNTVRKTYKLYIGGAFPRSESGRSYEVRSANGQQFLANASLASRKDARDAVVAARKAFPGWSGATAYNRGQILYRIAEMLEGRRAQFVAEVIDAEGVTPEAAAVLVDAAIDRWVWYAGWSDKVHQVAGAANPVAGPYFNFSVPEPSGVVAVVAPELSSLLGLVSVVAPVIVGGNTCVVVASEGAPLPAVTLCEVLATSDLPGGVVNLLTGNAVEIAPWLASHMDVNGIDLCGIDDHVFAAELEAAAAENLKRVRRAPLRGEPDWSDDPGTAPLLAFLETKTVWHPVGI